MFAAGTFHMGGRFAAGDAEKVACCWLRSAKTHNDPYTDELPPVAFRMPLARRQARVRLRANGGVVVACRAFDPESCRHACPMTKVAVVSR